MRPLVALAALAAACSVPNPDHCSNRSETCQDLGLGAYCSACIADNNGCVRDRPSDACIHGDPAPDTSSAPTTSSSTSTTSTTTSSSSESSSSSSFTSSSTSTSDTTDTSATTEPPPKCGDNTRDPGEQCDGADLGDDTCNSVNQKWGGGTLQCAADCKSFDQSMCCLNVGQTCVLGSRDPNQMCCTGDCLVTCM